eukprot:GHVU01105212.1.p4 GENE.GHVU01105212.1~~GHVU01105212.1.p4  ORF type:complete len:147 (+),score=10.19 GHVU01105212.1:3242-3682(+)
MMIDASLSHLLRSPSVCCTLYHVCLYGYVSLGRSHSLAHTLAHSLTHSYTRAVRLVRIRKNQEERRSIVMIQSAVRRYIVQSNLQQLYQAAYTAQRYALATILRRKMEIAKKCVIFIQAWWRGDRVRRILREEKLKLLIIEKRVSE